MKNEIEKMVVELYPDTPSKEIAKILNIRIKKVYNIAYRFGIKKSDRFMDDVKSGRFSKGQRRSPGTEFKKGQIPSNKGKKQVDYMSDEAIKRTQKTQFKKGHTPHNHKPIGYERKTKDGYIEIKIKEPNIFKLKHRHVWEQQHGSIPKGFNVQFKDGNRDNTDISNLYIISRNEQINNNSIVRYPTEIRQAITILSKLNKTIKKYEKSKS